jgi:WhiB family redox-sensing transcriptional regulator
MPSRSYRGAPPNNWFVDPVRLGVPRVRHVVDRPDALAWQTDALCAETSAEAFFPEVGGSARDAKKICASCSVAGDCLEYALENDERYGVWGGLSERERRRLRQERAA